jgi:HTH-type transcriptional regulator/antitoxin HigA
LHQSDTNLVSRKARLYEFAPVGEMQKRGWIEKSSNFDVVESQVLRFFEKKTLDEPTQFLAAARKSTAGDWTPSQKAWLMRARQLAKTVKVVGKFTAKAFEAALQALSLLKDEPEEIRKVPRVLSEAGIRFLIVAPLPQSKIDGACFWLSDKEPVVVMSFRYDRIDWFWHTLMHELGHVSNGDGKNAATLDVQLVGNDAIGEGKPEVERKADAFAVAFLVDQGELDDFIARTPVFSRLKLVGFAKRLGVNPGIVVGQLQYRKLVPYTNFRPLLTTVRNLIMGSALTDGWSATATI